MRSTFTLLLLVLIVGCSPYKAANSALVSGNFNEAFYQSLQFYTKNPSVKNAAKYMPIIHQAYHGAMDADEARIKYLEADPSNSKYKELYYLINGLQVRQEAIAGVNNSNVTGNRYNFKTKDYSKAMATIKLKYAEFLYQEARGFLARPDKKSAQDAYYKLQELQKVYGNYLDSPVLMQQAKSKGTYLVLIELKNSTNVVIPKALERDLLDFNSYGLDSQWTEFYSGKQSSVYDYIIQLHFDQIVISPEQEKIEVHTFEKKIIDGKEELVQNGEIVKDKDGKPIVVDRYITVKSRFEEYMRRKEATITAQYFVINNANGQILEKNNLVSQYVFRDSYGKFSGDRRALEKEYINMIGRRPLAFPSNEQMVFDSGQDLKQKFKNQIKRLKI